VPAVEVMVVNARIRDLIRENRSDEIHDAVADGEYYDMQTFHSSLIELVLSGEVERDVAANAASNQHDFLVALEHAIKEKAARENQGRPSEPDRPTPLVPGAGALRVAGDAASAAG
jgi:Tfp pilus assembly ATPase PilU